MIPVVLLLLLLPHLTSFSWAWDDVEKDDYIQLLLEGAPIAEGQLSSKLRTVNLWHESEPVNLDNLMLFSTLPSWNY